MPSELKTTDDLLKAIRSGSTPAGDCGAMSAAREIFQAYKANLLRNTPAWKELHDRIASQYLAS